MSYQSTALKVMIATPSDVATERVSIRGVIHEWNAIHSEDKGIVLMPVGWDTHSIPEMGDRPQGIINKQVLAGCDLLVAVFWTRLGSPTGKAPSGTVEEIEEHLRAGKPTMIYFSSEPVRMDSVDEEQYAMLRQFREECRKRGLVETYADRAEFREKFARHLAQTVIRWHIERGRRGAMLGPGEDDSEAEDFAERVARRDRSPVPALSETARGLLAEACADPDGTVIRVRTSEGLHVQTNGKDLVNDRSPREEARWQAAIDNLCEAGLLRDRGDKGEVFGVTQEGYDVFDVLRVKVSADNAKKPVLSVVTHVLNAGAGEFVISIKCDSGSAIAPYLELELPAAFRLSSYGLDGNGNQGLPELPHAGYARNRKFSGDAMTVIHEGTVRDVTRIEHAGNRNAVPEMIEIGFAVGAQGVGITGGRLTVDFRSKSHTIGAAQSS